MGRGALRRKLEGRGGAAPLPPPPSPSLPLPPPLGELSAAASEDLRGGTISGHLGPISGHLGPISGLSRAYLGPSRQADHLARVQVEALHRLGEGGRAEVLLDLPGRSAEVSRDQPRSAGGEPARRPGSATRSASAAGSGSPYSPAHSEGTVRRHSTRQPPRQALPFSSKPVRARSCTTRSSSVSNLAWPRPCLGSASGLSLGRRTAQISMRSR